MNTIQNNWKLLLPLFMFVMSLILFCMMGVDKRKSKLNHWRIPEKRLFLFAILGGASGGTLGMYTFHHKTKHWYFAIFFPLLAVLQIAVCVWFLW